MKRTVLIVEPDRAARVLMDRIAGASGYASVAVPSLVSARDELDGERIEVAVIDEAAGTGALLGDVRYCRALYPRVVVLVTGTLLSRRVLTELLRLGVAGALEKPFAPEELRAALGEAMTRALPGHVVGLDYGAAMALSVERLAHGRDGDAFAPLGRARAVAPFDADAMALGALLSEVHGDDVTSIRAYRATLALSNGDTQLLDPYEGLARLEGYGRARPVDELPERPRSAFLAPSARDLRQLSEGAAPAGVTPGPTLILFGAGVPDGGLHPYLRAAGDRAFALVPGRMDEDVATMVLRSLGLADVPLVVPARTTDGGMMRAQ